MPVRSGLEASHATAVNKRVWGPLYSARVRKRFAVTEPGLFWHEGPASLGYAHSSTPVQQ
ncbi:hypothetical protein SAMN05444172_4546 [Burkholderia sp. GAS332]|nr:hypothetical protein SAMN05444172_4546 [Burkholderia sp. GAS332]